MRALVIAAVVVGFAPAATASAAPSARPKVLARSLAACDHNADCAALQLGDCTPTACSRSLWTTDGDRCDDRVRIVGHGLKLVGTPKCETRAARRALYPRTGV
jgi:hypothetical protein